MHAFVLAGGQSSRMGRDKARLTVDGRPLVTRAVDLLRSLGCEPRICGSRPDLREIAETVPDRISGCGPLGGIEAALACSDEELNLFIPVDMPAVPREFLCWMRERAEITRALATIPRLGDRAEPLCAVYSSRLLEGVRTCLAAGQFKMMAAIRFAAAALGEGIDVFQAESVAAALPPGCWPADPPLREWFLNMNTPAEYESLVSGRWSASGAGGHHPIS